ncbi:MAG: hypothetical protein HQL98_00870 [Magnetococcales bacterium]|nr:hypothetical protein [Magnetococcales bacterium]
MKNILIDPSYPVFNNNKLFDLQDPILNHDNHLLQLHVLKEKLTRQNISINTADLWQESSKTSGILYRYISLGMMENIKRFEKQESIVLDSFVIMEPPIVAPALYDALPLLTDKFKYVYMHNVEGNGYSLSGVDRKKLRRFYWPIPYNTVLDAVWSHENREHRIVVINGNHRPRLRFQELYSLRIQAMCALAELQAVDLYGRGWERWWSRESMWLPYWMHRKKLMTIYKGSCVSKFDILKKYHFCLCFENMAMTGYITEKIFDCLYAGTVPLYLGAHDIEKYIPSEVFIDCRQYETWQDMWRDLRTISLQKIRQIKKAGRDFLHSDMSKPFYRSMENIIFARE